MATWAALAGALSWGLQTRDGHPLVATLGVSAFASLFACAAIALLYGWADADGEYRSDVAYAALDTVNLTNCQLEQRVVPPGARVCVFGRFSAAKGGIVPSTGMQSPPKLILGSLDQAAARLASTARTRLVLGVLASAVAAGLLSAFMAN